MDTFDNIGFMAITSFFSEKYLFEFKKFIHKFIKNSIYSIGVWGVWHICLGRNVTVDESVASFLSIIYCAYEYLTVYLIIYLFGPLIKQLFDNIS